MRTSRTYHGGAAFRPAWGGAGSMAANLEPGQGIEVSTRTSGKSEVEAIIPTFRDSFDTIRPFWLDTPVLTSLDWSINVGAGTLDGIAQNNQRDAFRYGIEGDFDYAMKVERNTATSIGMWFSNFDATILTVMTFDLGTTIFIAYTGDANVNIPWTIDPVWLRIRRVGTTLTFYHKALDNDDWILDHTRASSALGHAAIAYLDSATTGKIYDVILHDNTIGDAVRSEATKETALADGVTIAVDASLGNTYRVTLGGNRTMGNPTKSVRNQKIIFKVYQDGVGSRTLAWDTKYRFSTDLPAPTLSTAIGALDYLGFIFNETDDKWDYIAEKKGF